MALFEGLSIGRIWQLLVSFLLAGILRFLFSVSTLVVAMSLAWALLAPQNFLYGVWHDHAGIAEGIEKYAPQNRYRPGFADTDRAQRVALFAQINRAIHSSGKGLAQIRYQSSSSHGVQPLLHESEITHLQDVANLLNFLFWCVLVNGGGWVLALVVLRRRSPEVLARKSLVQGLLIAMGLGGAVLLVFGPEQVFNQLHIWIFPDNHQWFFYYQESLMSTMMLAPTLFAWIAAALAAVATLFYMLLAWGINYRLLPKRAVTDKGK